MNSPTDSKLSEGYIVLQCGARLCSAVLPQSTAANA
jgi:hypothetical protein